MDVRAGDVERIDRIRELERVKSACAAAQAVLTVAFVQSQTAGLSTKRARDERVRRSVSGQVAVARRESPFRGGRHVGLATVLTTEMPNVFAALRSGVISEWRATLVVRETACLEVADRRRVDAELVGQLGGLSEKQVALAAARIGQRLDPGQYVARARKAAGDRRVSCRPAPDLMTYVTALVPVAWGVAVYAALVKHAAAAKAVGDPRSRGQLMADEFVHRITAPDAAAGTGAGAQVGSGSWIPAGGATAGTGSRAATGTDAGAGPGDGAGPGRGTGSGGDAGTEGESHAGTHTAAGDGSPADAGSAAGAGVAADAEVANGAGVDADAGAPTEIDRAAGSMPEPGAAVPRSAAGSNAESLEDPDPAGVGGAGGVGVIPPGVGLDIQLVMSDRTLFDGDNEPAILTGYGPIPAPLARRLVREAAPAIKSWVRRLYTDPGTGQLIDADSRRRLFSPAARQYLIARDQTCRGPFCDAPIRHADHVVPHEQGGPTRTVNGQGLCERCNHTKEQPGWQSVVDADGITITTPTGHTARSVPPPPPRSTPWVEDRPIEYWPIKQGPDRPLPAATPFERRLARLIRSA
jgi:hypothetical protein